MRQPFIKLVEYLPSCPSFLTSLEDSQSMDSINLLSWNIAFKIQIYRMVSRLLVTTFKRPPKDVQAC